MKKAIEAIFTWLGILWIMFSPFVVLISSILSTIKWYSLSNSIIQGVVGFVVGGLTSGIVMVTGITIITAAFYLVQKESV